MSQMAGNQNRTVEEHARLIREGVLTSEQWVKSCLEKIDATDSAIGAWAHLDSGLAMEQARQMDQIRRAGKPTGLLHGVPVGVKDIFDTDDQPTGRGSAIYAGRRPDASSAVVEKLKEAGAVILGKTVSTELAYMHPADTRNPHNPAHTPGGSSSGSAAAVAAGHVPLAIGSQTNGSTIRPASYCGIYGYKPTRGIISRRGSLQTSATLDQVGLFGQHPEDVALLCDVLGGYDASDNMSYLAPRPEVLKGYHTEAPIEPALVWIDLPYADRYSMATIKGCEEVIEILGDRIERIPAPKTFTVLIEALQRIYGFELYQCLSEERENHDALLSDTMISALQAAGQISLTEYEDAQEIMQAATTWFQQFFYDYDAIVTPAALGEAPVFEDGAGDPICCTIWTLCGLPCLSLPLLVGDNQLPVGIQLVAGENEDDRMFRTTRWLLDYLNDSVLVDPEDDM